MSAVTVAITLSRAWTRLYTSGATLDVCDDRRAEIASDLWEETADRTDSWGTALAVLGRTARGVPADIVWRLETGGLDVGARRSLLARGSGLALVMVVLMVVALAATRPAISGAEPYFSADFPRVADGSDRFVVSAFVQLAFAVVLFGGAGLLYVAFREHGRAAALIAGLALATSGVIMLAAGVTEFGLHDRAREWRDGGAITGDTAWFEARDLARRAELLGLFAIGSMTSSFGSFGIVFARSQRLPRLIGGGAALLGLVTAAGWVWYFAAGTPDAAYLAVFVGSMAVMFAFLVSGLWLLVRGARTGRREAVPTG